VAVGHKDVAVGGNDNVGRLVEEVGAGARDARFAKRHQDLSFRAELENLVSFAIPTAGVSHPEVAVAVHRGTVRKDEDVLAEGREQLPVLAVSEDRRFAASGARVLEAALDDVDRAVGRRFNRRHRRPRHPGRQLTPVARGAIRLGQIIANGSCRLRVHHSRSRKSCRTEQQFTLPGSPFSVRVHVRFMVQ